MIKNVNYGLMDLPCYWTTSRLIRTISNIKCRDPFLLQLPFSILQAWSHAFQLTRPFSKFASGSCALSGTGESIICCGEVKGVHDLGHMLPQSYIANAKAVTYDESEECTSVFTFKLLQVAQALLTKLFSPNIQFVIIFDFRIRKWSVHANNAWHNIWFLLFPLVVQNASSGQI